MIRSQLVDARNWASLKPRLIEEIRSAGLIGFDIETEDSRCHEGIRKYKSRKMVFDINRTTVTGFSWFCDGSDTAYYLNLAHADQENRIPWSEARQLLEARPEGSTLLCHNASFEMTMMRKSLGFELRDVVCTMQMAVSAFGPDEYSVEDFFFLDPSPFRRLSIQMMEQAPFFDPSTPRAMPKHLAELVSKITAKESDADHSYNGWISRISYGYGLKGLIEKFFSVRMTTFEEVLGDRDHMGQLTGEEVVSYGADDAYWCVRLFHRLLAYILERCPETMDTFFDQENPMVGIYSRLWSTGLKVNMPAVLDRLRQERKEQAQALRDFKVTLRNLLPFPEKPHHSLVKADKWYARNWQKYRQQIETFALAPPVEDDFLQCLQARGSVSNAWADEKGVPQSQGVNLSHYMPQRVMIYDLCRTDLIISQGKTQSDGEARGRLRDRFVQQGNEHAVALIDGLNRFSGIDQRVKLYLTPYSQLMDPETGRLYPTVSSELATRRMAASTPNPMQLAKRGESTYVRGFFEPDYDDHVILSCDWSGIELVEIGEFSADPEFIKAFGQIPHEDLHSGAAADVLSVVVEGLDEQIFRNLRSFSRPEDFIREYGSVLKEPEKLFIDLKGQPLTDPGKTFKYWRTEVGKTSNFGYWYSGFLGTTGERMGWDLETTARATDRYKQRFSVAEAWRQEVIQTVQDLGVVSLPDGHRRVRFEATYQWFSAFTAKFQVPNVDPDDVILSNYNALWAHIGRQIQKRACNQAVNAIIQGMCAAIAKRSILNILKKRDQMGWTDRELRFMIPIHDELVFSVHRDLVIEAISLVRDTMIDHPQWFRHCRLDASPAIGLTFEPFSHKIPLGQIEIFEAPSELSFIGPDRAGKRMTDDEVLQVVDYLFSGRKRLAA